MVTQVDWWQVKNAPPPGGSFSYSQANPSDGPFTTAPLVFDHSTGFVISDGLAEMELADLTQAGIIGTNGGQVMQGPFILVAGGPSLPPPIPLGGASALLLNDGGLCFYNANEGPLASTNAALLWATPLGFTPTLTLYSENQLELHAGNFNGALRLIHDATGDYLQFDPLIPAPKINTTGDFTVDATSGQAMLTFFYDPGTAQAVLDIATGTAFQARYSVDGNGGISVTDDVGNSYIGGILVSAGVNAIDWSSITGTPTTLSGYGITNAIPLPGGSPTSGDVLTWNGLAWDAAAIPGGTPTRIAQAGGSVEVDAGGNVIATSASGGYLGLFTFSNASYLEFDGLNNFLVNVNGATAFTISNSLDIVLGGTHGTLSFPSTNGWFLRQPGGYDLTCDSSGNCSLLGGGTGAFGVFGATPVPQQTGLVTSGGWNAGTSGNFLQTDDTWDGGTGGTRYSIGDIILALKNYGWFQP